MAQTVPEVSWAQRSSADTPSKNIIYLKIFAPDVSDKDAKIDVSSTTVSFSGYSKTKDRTYSVSLELYAEITPAESKTNHTPRDIEFVLQKKEAKAEFWPRLTKEIKKLHFLRTDFDKWVDEDEQDEKADDGLDAFGGGMGGDLGMGGMGGMEGMGGMGGIDFSKLGAGGPGGMPDLDDEDGEDEDMPDLKEDDEPEKAGDDAEEEEAEGKGKGKATDAPPKIEEVS